MSDKLTRDLRSTLVGMISGHGDMSIKEVENLSADICQFLIDFTDDQLLITGKGDRVYTYWEKVSEFKPNLHK